MTPEAKLRVFLGWSGGTSKAVASALWRWLPDVLQAVDPWLSEEDIDKGARWTLELAGRLTTAEFGIFCFSPRNLDSVWMAFEAGTMSRSVEKDRICPYLFKVPDISAPAPFRQFQLTQSSRADTLRMVLSLNKACGVFSLDEGRATKSFDRSWGDLERELDAIELDDDVAPPPAPQTDDMLQEILTSVRELSKKPADGVTSFRVSNEGKWKFTPSGLVSNLAIEAYRVMPIPPWSPLELATGLHELKRAARGIDDPQLAADFLEFANTTPRTPDALGILAQRVISNWLLSDDPPGPTGPTGPVSSTPPGQGGPPGPRR